MRQHDSGNNRKQSVIIILLTLILCVISFMAGVFIFKLSNKQSGQTSVVSGEEAGGQFENNAVNNSSITKEESVTNITKEESVTNLEESRNEQVSASAETVTEEEPNALVPEKTVTIVIDPGRGGDNVGRQVNRNGAEFSEKDINLRIGMFLREELQRYENINVVMTRENDIKVELEDRVKIASGHNADMLISIHNDTHGDVEGYPSGCLALTTSGIFRPELAKVEQEAAASILRELSEIGLTDRGILLREAENGVRYDNGQNADYYAIVRNGVLQNVPSILIEHTCMDNPGDFEKYLSNDDAMRSLAKADAQGIANYFGLTEKASGNKCRMDPIWQEFYTFFRGMTGSEHNIPVYTNAVADFGEDAGWRPPLSLNWEEGLPNTDSRGTVDPQKASLESDSYNGTIDLADFASNDIDTTREIGRILGLVEGKSDTFTGYYAVGNQVEIGVNEKGSPHRKIYNDGNPDFTIHGIRIGMDAAECRTLISENYHYFATKNNEDGTEYDIITWAEYGSLQFIYDHDGRLKAWQEYLINDSAE